MLEYAALTSSDPTELARLMTERSAQGWEILQIVSTGSQVTAFVRRAAIAGSQVIEGKAMRNAMARVLRRGKVVADERVSGLKRFKDDVREVATGLECGITLDGFQEFEEGDIVEFYRKEKQAAS